MPEYIDVNFNEVLDFIRNNTDKNDQFYKKTISLLRDRIQQLVIEESNRPICSLDSLHKERDVFNVKLLCLYLLSESDNEHYLYKDALFSLITNLVRLSDSINEQESLIKFSLQVLSCEKVNHLGKNCLGWDIFSRLFSTDIVAHRLLNNHSLVDVPERVVFIENRGTLAANLGKVKVGAFNKVEFIDKESNLVPLLSFFEDSLAILDLKSNKLKQSESDSIGSIRQHTNDLIRRQNAVKKTNRAKKSLSLGDTVNVKLINRDTDLIVETISPDYETVSGKLIFEEKMLFYIPDDFRRYMNIGDCFTATVVSSNGKYTFSICDEFKDFLIYFNPNDEVLSKVMDIKTDKKGVTRVTWWTEWGFPAYTYYVEGLSIGQYAVISLLGTGKDQYKHYVNAEFVDFTDDTFDESGTKASAIKEFVDQCDVRPVTSNDIVLDNYLPLQLSRSLFIFQKFVRVATEKYRLLCASRILAVLCEDNKSAEYLEFVSDYLHRVSLFAYNDYDKITPLEYPDELANEPGVILRTSIVDVLSLFGNSNRDDTSLSDIIENSSSPLLSKLATLVQSANHLSSVISVNLLDKIKKEILSNLSIDSEDQTSFDDNKGTFYGNEDITKEFKTSFFEAPDNSRNKQNFNVLKVVCGFLNSELGGTIYLGVADTGYAIGISHDFSHLREEGNGYYSESFDGYKRFILDDAKKMLQPSDIINYISMDIIDKDDVLAIKVRPYDRGIVKIEEKAFIRRDSESIEMDSAMMQDVIRRKKKKKKDESGIVNTLMDAVSNKKMVTLHGYSSHNSTSDRCNLEPFAFDDGYNMIWCYCPDEDMCKVYKISRIGSVEILDHQWKYGWKHKSEELDIFGMSGSKQYRVQMQLDRYSKLLLCEEYPRAKESLRDDKNSWFLDTKVRSLNGVGRFYLGLGKDHITIVDSPELTKYVNDFKEKSL